MPDHSTIQMRVHLALLPEDTSQLIGYAIWWRKPFAEGWELIENVAFGPHDLDDWADEIITGLIAYARSLPQVLPFE